MTALADRERAVAYLDARISRGDGADDCWMWTLKPDRDGYGVASFGGRQWRAHRLSYTVHVGDIPDGHDLDHVCETRLCVRPSHLEPVTNFENFVRKYLRQGRTREDAEKLAQWDVRTVADEQARKVALREALARAREAGLFVGAEVRVGSGATVWKVTHITPATAGLPRGPQHLRAIVQSTSSGHQRSEPLTRLTPLSA